MKAKSKNRALPYESKYLDGADIGNNHLNASEGERDGEEFPNTFRLGMSALNALRYLSQTLRLAVTIRRFETLPESPTSPEKFRFKRTLI